MGLRHGLVADGDFATAAYLNQLSQNMFVQVDTESELGSSELEYCNVAFVRNVYSLYQRVGAGNGLEFWTPVAGSAAIPPEKPTLSYTGTGAFSITNYDPEVEYVISVNTGTFTRTGAAITLNNATMEATVAARYPNGFFTSDSVIIGRAPLTNQNVQVQSTCASGDDNLPGFWILMPHSCTVTVSQVAPPPPNYVNAGSEYRRIT